MPVDRLRMSQLRVSSERSLAAPWSRGASDAGGAGRARASSAASAEEPRFAFCVPSSTSYAGSGTKS